MNMPPHRALPLLRTCPAESIRIFSKAGVRGYPGTGFRRLHYDGCVGQRPCTGSYHITWFTDWVLCWVRAADLLFGYGSSVFRGLLCSNIK